MYNITLLTPVQWYTVGTHSRYLRSWERPIGDFGGFFHMIKVIHTNRGLRRRGSKKSSSSFTAKRPLSGGTQIDGGGRTAGDFSTLLLKMDENSFLIVTRAPHARVRSDKVAFPVITSSIGNKYGTYFERIRKRRLCGQFGIKQSSSMNGGSASPRRRFLSNVFFVFRIRENP